jgi:hypothetical protein
MHGADYGRRPCQPSGKGHRRAAPSSLAGASAAADTGVEPSRKDRAAGTPKEPAVNNLFDDIATALGSITSYDDIAAGLAGVVFGVASASMFVALFVGSM